MEHHLRRVPPQPGTRYHRVMTPPTLPSAPPPNRTQSLSTGEPDTVPVIRSAETRDYNVLAELSVELGGLDAFPEPGVWWERFAPHTLVVVREQVVGYVVALPEGDAAVLSALVVAPGCRRRGMGKLLVDAAARRLWDTGCRRWRLNVKRTNDAAIRLYEGAGFSVDGGTIVLRVDRTVVGRLPVSERTEVRLLGSSEVPASDRLNAPPSPNEPWLGLYEHGHLVGHCRLLPQYPSLKPFRCTSPGHVRHLLEETWRRLPEGTASILVALDDEPNLGDTLVGAGARIELDVLRMTGGVPSPG